MVCLCILANVSTIVDSPTEGSESQNQTTEFGDPLYGGASSNYKPRPIRKRKRMQYPGSGKFTFYYEICCFFRN